MVDASLRFRPEVVDWWLALRALASQPGRVHRWTAADHPPDPDQALEQHGTVTLIACLRGVCRIESGRDRIDLRASDVVLVQAGAWHRHVALRAGTVAFAQGFLAGRSDYWLQGDGINLVAAVPGQPSRKLMEAAIAANDEGERRRRLAALIARVVGEASEPVTSAHPALLRMELAIWQRLHRPGGADLVLSASGLERAQAYRLFTAHFGTGPAALLRACRLDLARQLIASGIPAGEAGARCGFANRRTFARAFRARFGVTPSATPHGSEEGGAAT